MGQRPSAGANLNNNNVVGWNNPPMSLAKETVSLSDVNGNYFWNQEWLRARVTTKNGEVHNFPKAKLNLYSGEIHYVGENGAEQAMQNDVNTVVFYSSVDNSKIGTFKTVNGLLVHNRDAYLKGRNVYAQILTEGEIEFLKTTVVIMIQREKDPFARNYEWNFEPRESYFIEENGKIQPLGSIKKSHLFALVKKEEGDEEWLKVEKNKLQKETDIVAFLTYRNSLK